MVVDRFEVDFEGAPHRERLVRSDRVEELPVGLDFEAKLIAVVHLEPVQVLVLEGAEGALPDAVLVRRLPPCADVDRLRALLDEGGEAGGLEAWPVIRDERDRADLAGLASSSLSGRPPSRWVSVIACSAVSIASRWFCLVETCQPSSSFDPTETAPYFSASPTPRATPSVSDIARL